MKPGIPPLMLPEETEGPQSQGGDTPGEGSRNLNSGVEGGGEGALSTAGLPSRDGRVELQGSLGSWAMAPGGWAADPSQKRWPLSPAWGSSSAKEPWAGWALLLALVGPSQDTEGAAWSLRRRLTLTVWAPFTGQQTLPRKSLGSSIL